MTDELDLAPVVRSWLRETFLPASVASRVIDEAIREARTKRQQRHPWPPLPLPSTRPFGREHVQGHEIPAHTATDTTDYRPRPITATNGRAPTVIGRTQTMFSPVKAIVAGALIFSLGGMFLIAQPFDQPGSVPGAEQGAELAPPVAVTIAVSEGAPGEDIEVCTGEAPVICARSGGGTLLWAASDPRLSGTATERATEHFWPVGGYIEAYTIEIVNDEGAWVGTRRAVVADEGFVANDMYTLTGRGAHEGLVAFVTDETSAFDEETETYRGVIVEGGLPPFPEPVE